MRIIESGRILKIFDPGLLMVLALSLFAARPLLTDSGVHLGQDTRHHLFRMAMMQRSWAQGEYFPSWAEDTYWGYGSPLFHFYGSLTYQITSALQFVFNLNSVQAARWLLLACFLMCGAGMYLFCQRRSGRLGALIGGLVYVNSPYLFHVNALLRSAYPELFALSLFPILLWRLDALRDAPNARNFLLVLVLEVALINTHNLSAVLMTGIAFAWLAFEAAIQSLNREASQLDDRGGLWAGLALCLGIMAAAYFWLPVILERESVTLGQFLYEIKSDHWRSVGELFKVAAQFYSFERPSFFDNLHIGIAQWTFAFAGAGGALALYLRGYRTRHPNALLGAVFVFGLSLSLICMMTPQSQPIWDVAPALRFMQQHPWRFLGPVTVCMAYLASLNGLWLSRLPRDLGLAVIALAITAPVVCGLAIARTQDWKDENVDVSAVALINSRYSGATHRSEFFPSSASKDVDRSRLLEDYAAGYPIDKFEHSLLPPESQATLLQTGPEFHAWRISSPTPFYAEVLTFWWPGWTATVDDKPVPVAPSNAFGLISASLPAGDYTLRVFLGSTPARDLGALISVLALIGGLALAWRLKRLRLLPRPYAVAPPFTASELGGLLLASAAIIACFV